MSALQSYFNDFLSNIRLPDSLREELKKAHTELREHLKSDDITKDLLVDSFLQGSYARATCIKPEKGHKADVDVIYAHSFYAGAANANTKLAGEIIGVLAGPNPAEARAGLEAAVDFIENEAHFVSANDDDSIPYYAHCISRTGSYLSSTNGIKEGEALAYLIAPPLEAMYALDAAIKAADVTIVALYNPPSETNFGGGLLTGSQSACKAACNAFAEAVEAVAANPLV